MKLAIITAALVAVVPAVAHHVDATNASAGVVWSDIEYVQQHVTTPLRSWQLNRRQVIDGSVFREPLSNFLTYYTMTVSVGQPGQSMSVLIDTGSSDLWIPGVAYGGFDVSQSSTWNHQSDDFSIKYVKGYAKGVWGTDTVDFSSGATLHEQRLAVATDSSDPVLGVFGIGPVSSEASDKPYNNVPVNLVKQGLIAKNLYSIFLDDQDSQTGHILFGGIDRAKFEPPLRTIELSSSTSLEVTLKSVSVSGGRRMSSSVPVVLDTGTSLMYLPEEYVSAIAKAYGAKYDSQLEVYRLSQDRAMNVSLPSGVRFNVNGAIITVPLKELFWPLTWFTGDEKDTDYALTVMPNSQSLGFNILGDTFLRSAYVVYDLEYREISLAQVRYSDESDVVAVTDTIPGSRSSS